MRRLGGLALAFAFGCLTATGCSLPGSSSAASGARVATPAGSALAPANQVLDAEVAMPPGFPGDFPIYPHSRLTAAASFTSNGQVAWGLEWEVGVPEPTVQAFYVKRLNQGDWQFTNGTSRNNAIDGTFTRRSDSHVHGTLEVNQDAGPLTRILVSMSSPG